MTVSCPKGHPSTEADFCSECGARIGAASTEAAAGARTAGSCPDCNTKRVPDSAKFCELCGYNFETGAHGEIPMAPPAAPPMALSPPAEKWVVRISVDPALKEPESPEPPSDWSPASISAERETLLIGRNSQSRGIAPDIPLDFDAAVSHRHALLTRKDGDGWTIRDIGSSNGTRLNGKDLQALVDVPVNPGDRVTLGHWTCLTLSRESQP
ncbi:MAG: FHA domain-containing protein [Acidobacteriaceae bacterium]|nr:FHA domain-containing protein [Acidobacteriaceae bacterium]